MNYYKRHIGDYARDTGWLTTYQHGVYVLLLDWYYSNERPIPLDLVYRIVKARSGPERRAVDEVIAAFFDVTKQPGFAHNKHADIEVAKYQAKRKANSLIAKERESTKRAKSVADSCEFGEPSHKPLANSHKEANEAKASLSPTGDVPPADGVPACPHEAIVALYHEILPANPRIRVWDGARASQLRARWREDPKRQSLDYWRRFFEYIAQSPFLTGRTDGKNGRPFLPGLDWMVKAGNFAKIIEGRYHEREAV